MDKIIKRRKNKEFYQKLKMQKEERLRKFKEGIEVENLPYKNFINTLNETQTNQLMTFLVCEPRDRETLLKELKNIHEVYTLIASQKL